MKKKFCLFAVACLILALGTSSPVFAQGTSFTYQGRLDDGAAPANGIYDLQFSVFDGLAGGNQQGPLLTVNDLAVSNGLFNVSLDFGAGVFNGSARWLNIAVRPGASSGSYTPVAPRQTITPAPYAVFAAGANAAGLSGVIPASALSGTFGGPLTLNNAANSFAGSGSGLTSLNASQLTSGSVADARLSANVALRSGGNTFAGSQNFSGNVTVGSTSSSVGVNVQTAPGFYGFSQFDGTRGLGTYVDASGGWLGTYTPHRLNLFVGYGNADMVIDTTGNVGIGNNAPADPLQIGSLNSGFDQYLSLKTAGGNNYRAGLKFRHFSDSGGFNIEDDEHLGTNGLHFVRYPFGAPVSALFIDRFSGNVGIGKITPATTLDVAGEVTCVAVNITSDRNAKEEFQPIDARAVLERVSRLPITEWQYKTQPGARHIGPMAQDFHDAFALGHDERHIATVDADGVALAAIQGLNQKLEAEVKERDAQIHRLEAAVSALQELIARGIRPPASDRQNDAGIRQ